MDEIDIIDEALIDADPATVYAALGDLIRGKAQWVASCGGDKTAGRHRL